jgi:hypothetical protein
MGRSDSSLFGTLASLKCLHNPRTATGSGGSSNRTVLEQLLEMPGHGSPVSTIMPPEIVVPSLKLGGLRGL